MNKKQTPPKKKRGASVAITICFMAAIAMAGTYALNNRDEVEEQELALADQEEENSEAANAEELVINTGKDDELKEVDGKEIDELQEDSDGSESDSPEDEQAGSTVSMQTSGQNVSVNFNEQSQILWPVNGNVIMGYSMDQTVYFSTLDQYKYNPAMIIAGAEGDQVICGAAGVVKSIDNTAQTGTTVNIDLGNGYEVLYGQLKDVPLNVGDYVTATTVVGYVSQPTKYYSEEGCNVYFEMRKDGQPIDPLAYTAE